MSKKFSITAKCGNKTKRVVFPITDEIEEYIKGISRNPDDEVHFDVEGGKSVSVTLSIFNYEEKL